jgi:hypothetical protein
MINENVKVFAMAQTSAFHATKVRSKEMTHACDDRRSSDCSLVAWIFGISRYHGFYSRCPNCGRHITGDAFHEAQPSERVECGQRQI